MCPMPNKSVIKKKELKVDVINEEIINSDGVNDEIQEVNEDLVKVEETKEQSTKLDLSRFKAAKSKSNPRGSKKAGVISIINSKENGKRLIFSKELFEKLNRPDKVQMGFSDNEMLITEEFNNKDNYYYLRESNKRKVIYASNLVEEITDRFNLDFSENKVSITLHEVEYLMKGDYPIALIRVNK